MLAAMLDMGSYTKWHKQVLKHNYNIQYVYF